MANVAAELLYQRMERAFRENPRGELYRTIPTEKLLQMLEQNIAEVKLAYLHGNDVEDKLADCGNYVAFLLRNYVDPLPVQAQGALEYPEAKRLLEAFLDQYPAVAKWLGGVPSRAAWSRANGYPKGFVDEAKEGKRTGEKMRDVVMTRGNLVRDLAGKVPEER